MSERKENDIMPTNMNDLIETTSEVDLYPTAVEQPEDLDDYVSIPFTKLTAAGTAFDSIAAAFQFVASGGQATSGIYSVVVPNGGHLFQLKNGAGYIGSVAAANGGVGGGQAILNPIVCNPATLCLAATLMSIDMKLNRIQELQQEVFDYIKEKDKASQRGDLNFLNDIMKNYMYNWENDTYKQAHLIKTQDIKQTSEQSIEHFRSLINRKIRRKGLLQTSQKIQKRLDEVEDYFQDYSLALYLNAFATFLEIMLLENYDSEYLKSIANRIEDYSLRYRELYTDSYNKLEYSLNKSVQGQVLNGLAKANKGAGDLAERIPVIEKTPIDDGLQMAGEKIADIRETRTSKRMRRLIKAQNDQVKPFVDNIRMVNAINNEPVELMFDSDNMYIKESYAE